MQIINQYWESGLLWILANPLADLWIILALIVLDQILIGFTLRNPLPMRNSATVLDWNVKTSLDLAAKKQFWHELRNPPAEGAD